MLKKLIGALLVAVADAVLAADLTPGPSPESIGKLWRARAKAKVIDLGPGANEQLTIEPMEVR